MANKLLLIEDVEGLGRSGDIVTSVRPGYVRNFLLPQGLAIVADSNAIRMQARLQEQRRQKAIVDKKESEEVSARLQDQTLTTIVKVDHEGHMYGSVSAGDIVHILKDQLSLDVEKRFIQLPHAIKKVGVHPIKVKLKEGINATFDLKVISEEGEAPAAEVAPAV